MNPPEITLWDPVDENLSIDEVVAQQNLLLDKIQSAKERPDLIKIYIVLCSLIPLAALSLWIFHPYDLRVLVISFAPPVMYYHYVRRMQEEMILLLVSDTNNWLYKPGKDTHRADLYGDRFPNIFKEGHDQSFDEQIWGKIEHSKGVTPFLNFVYHYVIGSGRSQSTINEHIFMLELNKPLAVNFTLVKNDFVHIFSNHIKTESEAFNKKLQVISVQNDNETIRKIIALLSPSVQTRLTDFVEKYSVETIYFQDDIMIVVLQNKIWKTKYTNFFKNVSIDSRDEEIFNQALVDMAELPTEMLQFMD